MTTLFENDFVIDDEIKALLRPHSKEENDALEAGIRADLACDQGVVAIVEGRRILADGHHRLGVCSRLGIQFPYRTRKFKDMGALKTWIINNQLGRRNLSPQERAYLIGKDYQASLESLASADKMSAAGRVAGKIGAKHGVTERTVYRANQFAEKVDQEAEETGVEPREVIQRKTSRKKEVYCSTCQRLVDQKMPAVKSCAVCQGVRKQHQDAQEPLRDENGVLVPEKLRGVFEAKLDVLKAIRLLAQLSTVYKRLETSDWARLKLTTGDKTLVKMGPVFKNFWRRTKALTPWILCPHCEDGCDRCQGGVVTREVVDAEKAKELPL